MTHNQEPIAIGPYQFSSRKEALTICRAIFEEVASKGWTPASREIAQALCEMSPKWADVLAKAESLKAIVEIDISRKIKNKAFAGALIVRFFDWRWRIGYGGKKYRKPLAWEVTISPRRTLEMDTLPTRLKKTARLIFKYQIPEPDSMTCGICGSEIDPSDLHMDHFPHSFDNIFSEWRKSTGLTFEQIGENPKNSCSFSTELLTGSWRDFHEKHAKFRPTHSRCNLTDKVREPLVIDHA